MVTEIPGCTTTGGAITGGGGGGATIIGGGGGGTTMTGGPARVVKAATLKIPVAQVNVILFLYVVFI
jgi:hypothetical protein